MTTISEDPYKGQSAAAVNDAGANLLYQRDLLSKRDKKFRDVWAHKGYGLPCQGCYEVLVHSTAAARWPDDAIFGMLAAHCREFGSEAPPEPHVQALIKRARTEASRGATLEELELVARPARNDDDTVAQEKRVAIRECLSRLFGLDGENEITRLVRYASEPAEYGIGTVTVTNFVRLGDIRNLIEQNRLHPKLAELTGRLIPKFKAIAWRVIAQALLDACDHVAVGSEATDVGLVNSWLRGYLVAYPVLEMFDEHDGTRCPFWHDQQIFFFGAHLRTWIQRNCGDKIPPRDMGIYLRRAHAEPATPNVYRDGKRTSVAVWRLPRDLRDEVAARDHVLVAA